MSISGVRRVTLTRRLILAQCVVIAAMVLTVVAMSAVIGPSVFDQHMREAGHGEQPAVLHHAQEAFRSAGLTSLAVGLTISVIGAVLASALLARQLGARARGLAAGSDRVAAGIYDDPVPLAGTGDELDAATAAFNEMTARVGATESTRRRMLTDLAHEMRTPVAAIDVTLEALEDGVVVLDATTLETLHDQTRRLARLAADISAVSAAEEGRLDLQPVVVDARDLVTAAVSGSAGAARDADLVVDVRLPSAPLLVRADPARIGQVLDNLLRNARQHTPSGGRITVSLGSEVVDGGAAARFVVADTGHGIGADDLPHVFERFFRADAGRTRSDATGTGVGLSISRAIAVAHGGTLTAASDGIGHGATFTLVLPLQG